MKRVLRPDEARLWAKVAATVRLAPGRTAPQLAEPSIEASPPIQAPAPSKAKPTPAPRSEPRPTRHRMEAPETIEPRRLRRLTRERDALGPKLDLHGLNQDAARARLHEFIRQASAEGCRAVLVITGKGSWGDGLLRRRTRDWLAEPAVRGLVAGVSEAHRRHGGAGALYVALRRAPD
jgi:DNA-nicking Smr family endonuclease